MKKIDLDKPLLHFTDKSGTTPFTIRDSFLGVTIFGSIGSGKTTGSGALFAQRYLTNGYSGLVLSVKKDELENWKNYCRLTGREKDLVIIGEGSDHRFNFLEYISSASGSKKAYAANIVDLLMTVIKASEEPTGKGEDSFWHDALQILMASTVNLSILAYGYVSVELLYEISMSAPMKDGDEEQNPEKPETAFSKAFKKAQAKVNEKIDAFETSLPPEELDRLKKEGKLEEAWYKAVPDAKQLTSVYNFFIHGYRTLHEKTRSIISFSLMGLLFGLLSDPINSLFCEGTSTVVPEDCYLHGKIIFINLPVTEYNKIGRVAQLLVKFLFQKSMEKRDITSNGRPCFLFADEAQTFIFKGDTEHQAIARSSRIATVFLSQNITNYHANMTGSKSEYRVKALLGTMGLKVFHANTDIDTNHYASDLIGEAYTEDNSRTTVLQGEFGVNKTVSYSLEKMVRPEHFVALKCGGPLSNMQVGAYIHKQGTPFHTGVNFLKTTFNQNIK